jgi:acyl-CoA synthetase (AMP-forming)/AMP-acid ligase II
MKALTMDYPLTISAIVRRAEALFGHKQVTSRLPDKSICRHSYADVIDRARRLAVALRGLGVQPGDRVATLGWNHHQHLEAYFAIPTIGAVLHTLNLRLHPDDLTYIVNDAGDHVLLVDESLLPLFEQFRSKVDIDRVIVMARNGGDANGTHDYEALIAAADPARYQAAECSENDAAAMCYTSGTTGRPKGVVHSHRAIMLHSLMSGMVDGLAIGERETVMPVVPMFHVNAWGLPFSSVMSGANLVLPGPCLDAASLLELCDRERVTFAAGVPTVWLGVLAALDSKPGAYNLTCLRTIMTGGAAAPVSLIQSFEQRHGLRVVHAWGMTEAAPVGSVCWAPSDLDDVPAGERYAHRAKQGPPVPLMEFRARSEQGLVPWDGQAMGELEMRGPWVANAYYKGEGDRGKGEAEPEGVRGKGEGDRAEEVDDRFTEDGWFKTGDIVTIDPRGCIDIRDRSKDLVKSGGEWISSIALENALMGHPAIAEAAVVGVPHARWDERPLAVVALKPGQSVTADELIRFLEPAFAKWWLPDAVAFVDQIPRTSAGKFRKSELRERFRTHYAGPS